MHTETTHRRPGRMPAVLAAVLLTLLLAACAPRMAPPMPATPGHPDFLYPVVPQAMQGTADAERIDRGWRYLQNGDLRGADREFAAALRGSPDFYPAHAGDGYVALVRRDYDEALAAFDAALRRARAYPPALVGRGQALLALGQDGEALTAFEAAVAADPSLTDVLRRVEVLRFRGLQEMIENARQAAAAGRYPDARRAYGQAIEASPESAFLHRELGIVERLGGDPDAALDRFRRASDLDEFDSESLVQIGEVLEQRQDFGGAEAAYRRAAEIEPSPDLSARIAAIADRARESGLPGEFAAIPRSVRVTRGDLAALIGVRLEEELRRATERPVVLTDARGHWAAPWIDAVARADVMPPFDNHEFQPGALVRRGDLAVAVHRLLMLIAPRNPAVRASLQARPIIADVPPGHLSHAAVVAAVASDVMPLPASGTFEITRVVTGEEAVDAIGRLQSLAVPR